MAGGAIGRSRGGQAGGDGGDAGHDCRRVHCGGRLQAAHVETHSRHANGRNMSVEYFGKLSLHIPGLIVHKRRVEAPGKSFGEGGAWHLGCPVVVGGVTVACQRVLGEGLHQAIELSRPKTSLAKVRAGIEQVSLPLSPFCSPVLEPNLKGGVFSFAR